MYYYGSSIDDTFPFTLSTYEPASNRPNNGSSVIYKTLIPLLMVKNDQSSKCGHIHFSITSFTNDIAGEPYIIEEFSITLADGGMIQGFAMYANPGGFQTIGNRTIEYGIMSKLGKFKCVTKLVIEFYEDGHRKVILS